MVSKLASKFITNGVEKSLDQFASLLKRKVKDYIKNAKNAAKSGLAVQDEE